MSRYLLSSITGLVGGFLGVFLGIESYEKFLKTPDLSNNLQLKKEDKSTYVIIDAAKSCIATTFNGLFGVFLKKEEKKEKEKEKKTNQPNKPKLSKADKYKHAIINVIKLHIARTIGGIFGVLLGAFIGWKSFPLLQSSPQLFLSYFHQTGDE
jgi:hypothetical protein